MNSTLHIAHWGGAFFILLLGAWLLDYEQCAEYICTPHRHGQGVCASAKLGSGSLVGVEA